MEDKQKHIGSLAHWLASGNLDSRMVLPAIEQLAGAGAQPESLLALLEAAETEPGTALASLAAHLRDTLRREAWAFHESLRRGQLYPRSHSPALNGLSLAIADEWRFAEEPDGAVAAASRGIRDLAFAEARAAQAPRLFLAVRASTLQLLSEAHARLAPLIERARPEFLREIEELWPEDLPGRDPAIAELKRRMAQSRARSWEQAGLTSPADSDDGTLTALSERFLSASDREEKASILDRLCSWPTPAFVDYLNPSESWARDRVLLNLILRFGQPALATWADWSVWLTAQRRLWEGEQLALGQLVRDFAPTVLLIFYSQLPTADPAIFQKLAERVYAQAIPVDLREFVQAWQHSLSEPERRALMGIPEPPQIEKPPIIAEVQATMVKQGAELPPILPPRIEVTITQETEPPPPPRPPKPSIWENHIQPLFVENWYIVAGIAMVILGSSLLAYYTWDKHWLVRYTIMPALLALFTWSLAGVGSWIERKSSEFKGTAAILRTAAIGLLPVNFMAMALLSADEKVPQKVPALLVMAAIYLGLFGWGLRRWCGAVEPALRNRLAGGLLFLNALVAVGPLAKTVAGLDNPHVLQALGAGFYAGFLVAAWVITSFARRILTREMAEEKRVPWFVAGALGITYLQVFIWVHGFMRHLPHAHTYALLMIGIGWLILYAERRALELRQSPEIHGGESFLGFAGLGLGLLMGFTDPKIRILSFLVAGAIWLYQALSRKDRLHYWIALSLLGLGGASIGLLPDFPKTLLPLLGIVLALSFGAGFFAANRFGQAEVGRACLGMQAAILLLTTILTPLVQWHYGSEPWHTAGWLLLISILLAWRAFRDGQLRWLHTTALVLALALPYAGFVDVKGQTFHHNTMVFGLSMLAWFWIAACSFARRCSTENPATARNPWQLLLQARSTVLWCYGGLGMAAMLLRVMLGDTAPEPLWYRDFMDYTGPILMMIALIPATYFSRSLVPAGMAVVIMAVLFPELRANLQHSLPGLTWGSGLGSAISGLLLVGSCFVLRDLPSLKALPEGDRFLGRELFPFRRHDYTLFTWPIVAAVLFLLFKVDLWNLARNFAGHGIPIKTAVAVGLTAVAWTVLGIYRRKRTDARAAVHLGWITMLVAIQFGYWGPAQHPHWDRPLLAFGLLVQVLYWLYRFWLENRFPWVKTLLTAPMRAVLIGSSLVLACLCVLCLLFGTSFEAIATLCIFVAALLTWHGLATRRKLFGAILFFHAWSCLLAVVPASGFAIVERVFVEHSLTPTLWFVIGIQAVLLAIECGLQISRGRTEPSGELDQRMAPLLSPFLALGSFLAVVLGLAGIVDGVHTISMTAMQQALLVIALLLTARAQSSGFILLSGLVLSYVAIHRDVLTALTLESQAQLLLSPWRVAVFALALVLLAQAGRLLASRRKVLLTGPFSQRFFLSSPTHWLFIPGLILAALGALYHTLDGSLRDSATQLWCPYLSTVTFGLVAWFWSRPLLLGGAGPLLLLGNIHLVRVFAGAYLRVQGLSELHLVCLGISLTLLQASLLRRMLRSPKPIVYINLASLGLAASVLVLLSINYFIAPDLTAMSPTRFMVSGAMALLASLYFRRAARQPGPGEQSHTDLCEALYHFGIVVAIWCVALLLPWFQKPEYTLIALGLPAFYFYLRAEFGMRAGEAFAPRYRNSATVLGFVVLGLYLFKGVFHMVALPGVTIPTDYYHQNAPLVILLGVLLLRLHGLGGTNWLAFYGGVALMAGSYFLLTWLPGFSPFINPIPSAWCALGLAHFWIMTSYSRSPVRSAVQRLAALDDKLWHDLRHWWGICLLVATQGAAAWGLVDGKADTLLIAPLIAAAATIFIHQAVLRSRVIVGAAAEGGPDVTPGIATRLGWDQLCVFYFVMAAMEWVIALHMDFFVQSYLEKHDIIWALLLIWLVVLAVYQFFSNRVRPETIGQIAIALGVLVFGHVLYQVPWRPGGLWGMGLIACLAAWTPQPARLAPHPVARVCAGLLFLVPSWLAYFSQADFEGKGFEAGLAPWPILAATATLFLTGLFAKLFASHLVARYTAWPRSQFRLFDTALSMMAAPAGATFPAPEQASATESLGERCFQATLWITLVVAVVLQVAHYREAFSSREATLLIGLEASLAVAWWKHGRERRSLLAYYLMQICAMACFVSIRRHLMFTLMAADHAWHYEYDVWTSLAFSVALAGARQALNLQPRAVRAPLLTGMVLLPVVALIWVLVHGLGVNMALLVVGLHSVLFAYLGKDDRESPYNIVALAGFVTFILITFYSKLHLRAVHAYIIPTGLGILVLQELFRHRIPAESRNWIRLVTLMAMLGSSAYYALTDPSHEIVFNLTMIFLSLLCMVFGSLLRIRLYLAMGFAGLMVDLVSILYKVLVQMERSARMTIIGSLVLGIGAVLVFGAIYYKTNKDVLNGWVNKWRGKLAEWQ